MRNVPSPAKLLLILGRDRREDLPQRLTDAGYAVTIWTAYAAKALPGLPDESPTLVNPYPAWRETPGVILCYAWPAYGRAGSHDTACEQSARDWLSARGRPVDVETVTYQADGWRFIRSEPRNATVFWVVPLP